MVANDVTAFVIRHFLRSCYKAIVLLVIPWRFDKKAQKRVERSRRYLLDMLSVVDNRLLK